MFIAKKHIPRRTILRGAGAAFALPFLEAMVPARTLLAQTAANPKPRFVGLFVPHGGAPGYWVPEKVGALPAELPYSWKPLEDRKSTRLNSSHGYISYAVFCLKKRIAMQLPIAPAHQRDQEHGDDGLAQAGGFDLQLAPLL